MIGTNQKLRRQQWRQNEEHSHGPAPISLADEETDTRSQYSNYRPNNTLQRQRSIQRRFGMMCHEPPPPPMEYSSVSSSSRLSDQRETLQSSLTASSASPSSATTLNNTSTQSTAKLKRVSERRMNRRNASVRHELRDISTSIKSMTLQDSHRRRSLTKYNHAGASCSSASRQSVQSFPSSVSSLSQDSSSNQRHRGSSPRYSSSSYQDEGTYAYDKHYEDNYDHDNDSVENDEDINGPLKPLIFVEPSEQDVIIHEHGSLKKNHFGNHILHQVIYSYISQGDFQEGYRRSTGSRTRSRRSDNTATLDLSPLDISITMNVVLDVMKDRGGRFLYQRSLSSPKTEETDVSSLDQEEETATTAVSAQYYEMDDYSAVEEIGHVLRRLI